jgi:hypothetical protein
VTDVQVTVGLRREPGVDGLAGIAAALGDILVYECVDEIFAFSDFSHRKLPLLLKVYSSL